MNLLNPYISLPRASATESCPMERSRINAVEEIAAGRYDEGLAALRAIDACRIDGLDPLLHLASIGIFEMNHCIELAHYEMALECAISVLNALHRVDDKRSLDFLALAVNLLYNLALVYNLRNEFDVAEKGIEKCGKIVEKCYRRDAQRFEEASTAIMIAKAEIYKSRLKVSNVLMHYHATTELLLASYAKKDVKGVKRLISSMMNEGNTLLGIGNYKEATKCIARAIKIYKATFNEPDVEYLRMAISLAKAMANRPAHRETAIELLGSLRALAVRLGADDECAAIDHLMNEPCPKTRFFDLLKGFSVFGLK